MADQFSPWSYLPSEDEIDAWSDVGFDLHDFLKQHYDSFPRRAQPLALAHIGYLIRTNEIATAIELLDKIEQPPRAHVTLISFLRFLATEAKDVRGRFPFSALAESDVYLAACYFHKYPQETHDSNNDSPLYQRVEWKYGDVVGSFFDQKASNTFKAFGVQPRVAELAFRTVYESMHGSGSTDALRDENLKAISTLPRPWRLGLRPNLPPSDYVSVYGLEFDVKSNVFLRSKKHLGLRGFCIPLPKRESSNRIAFPGIVFCSTDDDGCSWVYVGDYEPEHLPRIETDRVMPFAFRVPDANRFVVDALNVQFTDDEFQEALQILPLESLRFGWKLACQRRGLKRLYRSKFAEYLDLIVNEYLRKPAGILLEYRLWEAINSAFFRVRAARSQQEAAEFLRFVSDLTTTPALPVHYPAIGRNNLLSEWIKSVLEPVNEYWDEICCPHCKSVLVKINLGRITAAGSIIGKIDCEHCGESNVTIVTHCIKCGNYPLIVGKNKTCEKEGCACLVCDWEDPYKPGSTCGGRKCNQKVEANSDNDIYF